ncbi:MAG: arginine--tRNA ligase [Clostridiales bacterium]|jgi:arginyl-tRNA synthetase|nr:arginine--tRNA ligase [Clostridiales bacterium]
MDYKLEIARLIDVEGLAAEEIAAALSVPQDTALGDFALPCFRFAKALRKSPAAVAAELAEKLNAARPAFLTRVEPVNGYLNFFVDKGGFAEGIVDKYTRGTLFGASREGAGKTLVIDYSSVNIAKPLHIGHLSTTAIGGSLVRLFRHRGYTVVGINHLGDYGTQFGKMIAAYRKNVEARGAAAVEADIKARGVQALAEIYVQYEKLEERDPAILDEARAWSAKIERGDKEALALFNLFRAVTLTEVKAVYKRLGITFDSYRGERFFAKRTGAVVRALQDSGILEESDGAKVVATGADMPPCLILRGDGASLYATRDLAAAQFRQDTYHFDKCLYVVAYQQNLHFRQLFAVLEKMGKPWAKDCVHVAFGMVSLEEGSLSTRKGRVVLLKDVLARAAEKAKSLMTARGYTGKDIDKVAGMVGTGAVVYSALCSARIKDVLFSYDKVLNFEGETAPYLMYTHARCVSVLKKSKGKDYTDAAVRLAADAESVALLKSLDGIAHAVEEACRLYEPCVLAKQLIEVAACYNKFYFEHKILSAPAGEREARLLLTQMTRDALKTGLALLLIKAPERM